MSHRSLKRPRRRGDRDAEGGEERQGAVGGAVKASEAAGPLTGETAEAPGCCLS
jgi:hypothetical protein